ncbi:tachylectin-related carbohydrate-binding protein [Streptomyces mirabilis]|uniref:tachylectin-related carbohydrate-binding protein n=1 Tax=Streptomyces mirabilis TaxID=68239 RepID=UPI0036DF3202
MPDDTQLIETVVGELPFGDYITKGYDIVLGMYNFGRQSEEQKAIAQLQNEVAALKAALVNLNQRVDALNQRVVQDENLARMRKLGDYDREVEGLAFELAQSPDVRQLAIIAEKSSLIAESMNADEDLWLWSDLATDASGHTDLVPAEFKVIPLSVFGFAVSLFCLAAMSHIARDSSARGGYASTFETLYDMVSVRTDWVDVEQPPKTLPEKIRANITVSPVAATTYAVNGQCTYGLECNNRIDRTRVIVREVTVQVPYDSPVNTMCTAPPNLGLIDEKDIEDDYIPIKLLSTLEDALDRLRTRGTLADPPILTFPDVTSLDGTLYAVEPNGDLLMYKCQTNSHLTSSFGWATSGRIVGTGWQNFVDILPGYWNVLYAVQNDGSTLWYRHDGAAQETFDWSGPNLVAPARTLPTIITDRIEWRIPGTFGQFYFVRRFLLGLGADMRFRRTLEYLQHPGYQSGEGSISPPTAISDDWPDYHIVFGGSDNVIFGVTVDGRLFWHKHVLPHSQILGPIEIGSGWNMYRSVFSTGNGLIFGIYPNGSMMAYRLRNWQDGPTDAWPADWIGPVAVAGPAWYGFRRLIPCFNDYSPPVG